MMKIAIMLKQMFSKGNSKDIGIAVTQGICYHGILASKKRLEYRTIGKCVANAYALSALPQCQNKILIDDDCVSSYLSMIEADCFISNEALLQSNSYITPQKKHKEVSLIVHEIFGISKSIGASCYDLKSKEFLSSSPSSKKVEASRQPSHVRWKYYLKSFLEDGSPNILLVKGSPGEDNN
jgi:hypothetical protein